MKFSATFFIVKYSKIVYDPLIRNFRVWALDKRVRIFSSASLFVIRVNLLHP